MPPHYFDKEQLALFLAKKKLKDKKYKWRVLLSLVDDTKGKVVIVFSGNIIVWFPN